MVQSIKRRILPDGRSPKLVRFKCGIYEVLHGPSKRRYVGSSLEVEKRLYYHLVLLRVNKHHCQFLQRVWNKYGEAEFDFFLLEECEPDQLLAREQFHMDKLTDYQLMNSDLSARTVRGWNHSESTRAKMREAAKRVAANPIERQRRSERAKAQWAVGNIGRAKRTYPGV